MTDVPDQVEALGAVLREADLRAYSPHEDAYDMLAAAALAWVLEQLNDESLRDEVAAVAKGWHPLRASDTPVVNAVLAAVRAKFAPEPCRCAAAGTGGVHYTSDHKDAS